MTLVPPQPFFVLGVQRSGTTLLRLMLDAHSRIAVPFESFVLIDYYRRLHQYNDLAELKDRENLARDLLSSKGISKWDPSVSIDDLDLSKCESYAQVVSEIFRSYASKKRKKVWGDKTPSYMEHLDLLCTIFPSARYIHLIRDGRDVAESITRQTWGPPDFLSALRHWHEQVLWVRKMGSLLGPERYIEVCYEELVAEPKATLTRMMDFLGEEFEEQMLEFAKTGVKGKMPDQSMAYHTNLGVGVNPDLRYQWQKKLKVADQALALRESGGLLKELGYPVEPLAVNSVRLAARKVYHWASGTWKHRRQRLRKLKS